jgi:hypothetical protein
VKRAAFAVLLTGAVLVTAACSRPVEGVPSAPAQQQAPSSSAVPDRAALLEVALLRPAEVGPTWRVADKPTPNPTATAVCGGPGVTIQFPDAKRAGAELSSAGGELMRETLSTYPDVVAAKAAFEAYANGLACTDGVLGDTPVRLSPAEDVQSKVGGDTAQLWRIGSDRFDAVLVSVRAGDSVVNFVFVTPQGVEPARPDTLVLARTGVARLLAT